MGGRNWTGLAVALALALSACKEPVKGPGADGRLPQGVTPLHYTLALTIDPRLERFSGEAQIRLKFDRPTRRFWIHGKQLAVTAASLSPQGQSAIAATYGENGEGVAEIVLARQAPAGEAVLKIVYDAAFGDDAAGLYHNESGGEKYAVTQFQAIDARRAFPGFDQPEFKTPFAVSITAREGDTVIANTGETKVEPAGAGLVRHTFRETKPLPTYLLAFAVGPYDVVDGPTLPATGRRPAIPLRGVAVKGKGEETRYALGITAGLMTYFEDYFDTPYPYDKLDFIAAPEFAAGAMENAGAIIYNEQAILMRPGAPVAQQRNIITTHAHEIAHQWFGDYVTMRWFDDLWLKEGFATFMAARMQADLEPTSNAWKTFYLRNKPVAYGTDATAGTTPVWQALANLDQAKSNYGPIVYNKAPSILRQLEYLVGAQAFRRGVQRFLQQHPYGNATWQALLAAIGRAAGRDLTAWGAQWMLRPGMPLVSQEVQVQQGRITRLALVQRPAQPALSGTGAWPLKVQVRLHYADAAPLSLPVELTGDTTLVPLAVGRPAPAFVFANEGDYGYAIVLPDSASVAWLEQHIGTVGDDFLRAMLWGALWDLVREARLDPRRYAAMAMRALPQERDEQVAAVLLNRTVTVVNRYVDAGSRDALLPALEAQLLAGAGDTASTYGVRKAHLDSYLAVARRPEALQTVRQWLGADSVLGLPLRAPTRWSVVTRLVASGSPDADALIAAERERDNTTEGQRQAFVAAAAAPDAARKRALFTQWFADATLNEEWVTSSLRAFHEPSQQAMTRPYLIAALDSLPWIQQNRRIFFLGSWLGATLGGQTEPDALTLVDGWMAANPALPADLRQKVLQARDDLERTVRITRSFSAVRTPTP